MSLVWVLGSFLSSTSATNMSLVWVLPPPPPPPPPPRHMHPPQKIRLKSIIHAKQLHITAFYWFIAFLLFENCVRRKFLATWYYFLLNLPSIWKIILRYFKTTFEQQVLPRICCSFVNGTSSRFCWVTALKCRLSVRSLWMVFSVWYQSRRRTMFGNEMDCKHGVRISLACNALHIYTVDNNIPDKYTVSEIKLNVFIQTISNISTDI